MAKDKPTPNPEFKDLLPESTRDLEKFLENYGIAKKFKKTKKRLEEIAEKAEGPEKVQAQLALLEITTIERKLVAFGKRIVEEKLSGSELESVRFKIREQVTELKSALYKYDIASDTISSLTGGFEFDSKTVDEAFEKYAREMGYHEIGQVSRVPVFGEEETANVPVTAEALNSFKESFYRPLEKAQKYQAVLERLYWRSPRCRAYVDTLNEGLVNCAELYLKVLSGEVEAKDWKLSQWAGKLGVDSFGSWVDKHANPYTREGAERLIESRLGEIAKFVYLTTHVDTVYDNNERILEVFDTAVGSGDVKIHLEEIQTLASQSTDSFRELEASGFMETPYQDVPHDLQPFQTFAFASFDVVKMRKGHERLTRLAAHMQEERFQTFLEAIKSLNLGDVAHEDIPRKDLEEAYKTINSLYEGAFVELDIALDGQYAMYASPALKKVRDIMTGIRLELMGRETAKMDSKPLEALAKKFPKYVKFVKEGSARGIKFTDDYKALLEKGPHTENLPEIHRAIATAGAISEGKESSDRRTKKEEETISEINIVLHKYVAEKKLVEIKALKRIETNETVLLAYQAYEALKGEENYVKAKKLYKKFLETAETDETIDVMLLAEAKAVMKQIATHEANTMIERSQLLIQSLIADTGNFDLWVASGENGRALKEYVASQSKTLVLVSALLAADNDIVTIEQALNVLKEAVVNHQKSGKQLEQYGIKNGKALWDYVSRNTNQSPFVYLQFHQEGGARAYFEGLAKLSGGLEAFNRDVDDRYVAIVDVIGDYMSQEANAETFEEQRKIWLAKTKLFDEANFDTVEAYYFKRYFQPLCKKYATGWYDPEKFTRAIGFTDEWKKWGEFGEKYHDKFLKALETQWEQLCELYEKEDKVPTTEDRKNLIHAILANLHEEALLLKTKEAARRELGLNGRQEEAMRSVARGGPKDIYVGFLDYADSHLQHLDRGWYDVLSKNEKEWREFATGTLASLPLLLVGGALAGAAGRAVLSRALFAIWGEELAAEMMTATTFQLIGQFLRTGSTQILRTLVAKFGAFSIEAAVFGEVLLASRALISNNMSMLLNIEEHSKALAHSFAALGVIKATNAALAASPLPQNAFTKWGVAPVADSVALTGLQYAWEGGNVDVSAALFDNWAICLGLRGGNALQARGRAASSQEGRMRSLRLQAIKRGVVAKPGQKPLTAREVTDLEAYTQRGRNPFDFSEESPVTKGLTPNESRAFLAMAKGRGFSLADAEDMSAKDKRWFLKEVPRIEEGVERTGKPLTRTRLMNLFNKGARGRLVLKALVPTMENVPLEAKDLAAIGEKDPGLLQMVSLKLAETQAGIKVLAEFGVDSFWGPLGLKISSKKLASLLKDVFTGERTAANRALLELRRLASESKSVLAPLLGTAVGYKILTWSFNALAEGAVEGAADANWVLDAFRWILTELPVGVRRLGMITCLIFTGIYGFRVGRGVYRGFARTAGLTLNTTGFDNEIAGLRGLLNTTVGEASFNIPRRARATLRTNQTRLGQIRDRLDTIRQIEGFYEDIDLPTTRRKNLTDDEIADLEIKLENLVGAGDPQIDATLGDPHIRNPRTVRQNIDNLLRALRAPILTAERTTSGRIRESLLREEARLVSEMATLDYLVNLPLDGTTNLPNVYAGELQGANDLIALCDAFARGAAHPDPIVGNLRDLSTTYQSARPATDSGAREALSGQVNELNRAATNVSTEAGRFVRDVNRIFTERGVGRIVADISTHQNTDGWDLARWRLAIDHEIELALEEAREPLERAVRQFRNFTLDDVISALPTAGRWSDIRTADFLLLMLWLSIDSTAAYVLGFTGLNPAEKEKEIEDTKKRKKIGEIKTKIAEREAAKADLEGLLEDATGNGRDLIIDINKTMKDIWKCECAIAKLKGENPPSEPEYMDVPGQEVPEPEEKKPKKKKKREEEPEEEPAPEEEPEDEEEEEPEEEPEEDEEDFGNTEGDDSFMKIPGR